MAAFAVTTQILLLLVGLLLIIVILLQRGRGGGLAGAFGGLGGQSAFGTKAGDVFTKITVVMAIFWVILAGGSGYFLRASADLRSKDFLDTAGEADAESSGAGTSTSDGGGDESTSPLSLPETGSGTAVGGATGPAKAQPKADSTRGGAGAAGESGVDDAAAPADEADASGSNNQ
jgi:preprotein translocase subunit SecG